MLSIIQRLLTRQSSHIRLYMGIRTSMVSISSMSCQQYAPRLENVRRIVLPGRRIGNGSAVNSKLFGRVATPTLTGRRCHNEHCAGDLDLTNKADHNAPLEDESSMTQSSVRPPCNLQSRPKVLPSFSNTSKGPSSTSTGPQLSRPSSQNRQLSPARISGASDVSDKATAALIRRVLCPHAHAGIDPRPINELLPPLTSSNDIDLQLYAIIAIIVKDLVQSWYGKITPDQGFVEEVVRIVAHCTTQLESRLRTVDLEGLVFDELPELVEAHIKGQQSTRKPHFRLVNTA